MRMIEGRVPKDIRTYETKIVGSLTLRQIACVAIMLIVDLTLYQIVFRPYSISLNAILYTMIFIDVLIGLFGWYKPQNMKLEQYLKMIIDWNILAPTKRRARKVIIKKTKPNYSKKELKESQKRLRQAIKTDPQYIAYK